MAIKIALAGNPNCGKTTLFNALTGSNQFVGNWPGVTVEKKEGRLKGEKDIILIDLPGIYSLSPYTLEEVVARNYLISEKPDAILNIVDGTNLERNLYLSTQLLELGIPVVMAVNMVDIVEKTGDQIHIDKLSKRLGCKVIKISALKGIGISETVESITTLAKQKNSFLPVHTFTKEVEEIIKSIQEKLPESILEEQKRFFAIKLLEKDSKIKEQIKKTPDITKEIKQLEEKFDDDTESIITNERYVYISSIIEECRTKSKKNTISISDKIDRIVTNRWLALPIFAAVMFLVYFVSVTTVGTWATDWANDGVFGDGWHFLGIGSSTYEEATEEYTKAEQIIEALEKDNTITTVDIFDEEGEVIEAVTLTDTILQQAAECLEKGEPDPSEFGVWISGIPVLIGNGLEAIHCADWLRGLILDGIVAGVGAVLGFVPQMLVLFLFLAFLEACGYMARISFIPMLIGSGCGVPGIMASRTIENDRDRKMTIMTTTFIPCGAKLPIIAFIAGALFNGAWWVAPSAYFVGIAAIICSGIILKKTKLFAGDPAPFVMELPAYHMPTVGNVLRSMWERGWSFIKKAGTIILLSTIVLWFLMRFGWIDGQFKMLEAEELNNSILASIGNMIVPIFTPLGWGEWRSAVAAVTGLIAKENVVGTFGILYGFTEVSEDGAEIWGTLAGSMNMAAAYSFLVFNLLCAPCFAAMGAIKREMNNRKWFWFAISYQTILAYIVSLCIYQFAVFFTTKSFETGTVIAILFTSGFLYLLFRQNRETMKLRINHITVK